jgi:hypothetical protein
VTDKERSGGFVEIDEKKLGREGHEILGGLRALNKWAMRFEAMREMSDNIQERVFLKEVVTALRKDIDDGRIALAALAVHRGAKVHDVEPDAAPN